jgi:hypothetical protein
MAPEKFDPKAYRPNSSSSALAGLASAHQLELGKFTALLNGPTLSAINRSLSGVPDASGWRRWLVYDACLARYHDLAGVVAALHLDD